MPFSVFVLVSIITPPPCFAVFKLSLSSIVVLYIWWKKGLYLVEKGLYLVELGVG
jgi:hypothetical protein